MRLKTALCEIMRDEVHYVVEWIVYHRVIGFDRIIIYDNQSVDALPSICRSLAKAGLISCIGWPDAVDNLIIVRKFTLINMQRHIWQKIGCVA